MKKNQDWITILFVVIVIISIIFQIVSLILIFVFDSLDGWWKIACLGVNSGSFLYSLTTFNKIIKKRIEQGAFDVASNQSSASDQSSIIDLEWLSYYNSRFSSIYFSSLKDYPKSVIIDCLRFTENSLKKHIGNFHFELSIFTNSNKPEILYYVDSHGNTIAASKHAREKNPNYYIEKKYEVVELLKKPSQEVFVLSSVNKSNYTFIGAKQKKNIKSRIMYCFDVESPHVLVITCNQKNAFKDDDLVVKNFISLVGVMLNSELIIKKKFCCINIKEFACKQQYNVDKPNSV